MASQLSTPRTEAELLADLPQSNQPGAFPRRLIPDGERVFFETRPGLWGLYWGRLVVFALLALLFLGASLAPGDVGNPAGLFFFGLFVALMVYYILVWRGSAYAITDRRVLSIAGIRQTNFLDATLDQVQNLRLVPGLAGGIKFDATPPLAPNRLMVGRKYAKTIFWRSLGDSPKVYSFVQEAFALHARQSAQQGLRAALIARMTQDRLPCEYCGTLVDIRTVDYASPRCPSCGAPLVPFTAAEVNAQ